MGGTFDFRLDPNDGPPFDLHQTLAIERDGDGSFRTAGKEGPDRNFKASEPELRKLEETLEDLDISSLRERFPAHEDEQVAMTITFDGEAATLGEVFFSEDYGGSDRRKARQVLRLNDLVSRISATADPEAVRRAEALRQRELEKLLPPNLSPKDREELGID